MSDSIGLIRVSSVSQSDNTSLDNQRLSIKKFCQDNGISLSSILEEVYTGTTLNRDALLHLKRKVERYAVSTVIVYKIDRLMRSFSEGVVFIKFLLDNNVKIISTQEQIDTTTISGRFFINILLSMAEMERNTIIHRLSTGKLNTFSSGNRCCGKIPFGYKKDSDKGITVDATQQQIVKYIFRKWNAYSHLSKRKRTRRLLNTLHRRGYHYRDDQPFKPYHLRQIIRNRFYIGEMTYGDLIQSHNYDRLISKRLWNLCNNN